MTPNECISAEAPVNTRTLFNGDSHKCFVAHLRQEHATRQDRQYTGDWRLGKEKGDVRQDK